MGQGCGTVGSYGAIVLLGYSGQPLRQYGLHEANKRISAVVLDHLVRPCFPGSLKLVRDVGQHSGSGEPAATVGSEVSEHWAP